IGIAMIITNYQYNIGCFVFMLRATTKK
ncbi:uncharacterized protein METZ01_LOCUS300253, partial [marine metagenome]